MPPSDPPQSPDVEQTLDAVNAVNAGYVAELYEQFRRDPASVDGEWRALFESGAVAPPTSPAAPPATARGTGSRPAAPPRRQPPGAHRAPPPAPRPSRNRRPSRHCRPAPRRSRGPPRAWPQNMTASLAVPTATSFRDVPVATLAAMRAALNEQLAPRKISFTHLIGWAIVRAAGERAGDDPLLPRGGRHRVPGRSGRRATWAWRWTWNGPMAAASWSCRSSRAPTAWTSPTSSAATRSWSSGLEPARLAPDDMAGATITLTNPGTLGTTASVPRLMPEPGRHRGHRRHPRRRRRRG